MSRTPASGREQPVIVSRAPKERTYSVRKYRVASCFFLLAFAWNVEAKECTSAEARAAEAGIDSLKSWSSIYVAFEQYGQCDDGAIAEGWTEAVVHTLASNWDTLIQASQYAEKDDGFRRFLLKHNDANADTDEDEPWCVGAITLPPEA